MLFKLFTKPRPIRPLSRVYDLKSRLDWGEPALTIVDIRDRPSFNDGHITGAISIPMAGLVSRAQQQLGLARDIYLCAGLDEEAVAAAEQLKAAGYQRVSVVRGGAAAWKAAGFPIERTRLIAA
ncbi:MAG: rhodanese-like domain-containing protein [Leptolyngbya sp. RL_3_1]|nr:rhodanese-like domain-containing protein [Leptolyngbya sp. RL_3_1]